MNGAAGSIQLGNLDERVEVDTEQGSRITSLVLAGRERLIRTPCSTVVEPSLAWGCYLMAPFVGRISGGEVSWAGKNALLPRNHGSHSIHGATFDVPWKVMARTDTTLTVGCDLDRSRWPFAGRVTQRFELSSSRLLLSAQVLAGEPMPAALGWHPWFRLDDPSTRVGIASDRMLRLDSEQIPTGELVPVDPARDLRESPAIGERRLDDVYVDVKPPAIIRWPDLELRLAFSRRIATFVVYSQPGAFCVEPMTAWPDAIRLSQAGCAGTGIASLASGARLQASTTWSWTPVSAR